LPARSGALLEASLLQRRWQSLQDSLIALGAEASTRQHRWRHLEAALPWQGDTLVLLQTAQAHGRHALELWLQLLLAVAAGQPPGQAALVARKGDQFTVCATIQVPPPALAEAELERLLTLLACWRTTCWPVPPRSGWTYAQNEHTRAGTGLAKAIQTWEGGFFGRGEREEEAQALCFGSSLPGRVLFDDQRQALARELFGPLLDHLTWMG
jgi:exodeoxyribonuclease V gamma subunit